MSRFQATGPFLIESIRLVERFEFRKAGERFLASSLPGHLIHLVIEGRVEQFSNGRRQESEPGTLVWYHEDEWVEGRVIQAPWIFYSVNFSASGLTPPDFEFRLATGCRHLATRFERLLDAWRAPASWKRTFECQSGLLALLAAVDIPMHRGHSEAPGDSLWWEVESWMRANIERPVSMPDLCGRFHCSPKTLERACHATLGTSPMKRLKKIRMSLARGLVRFSELNMSGIAERTGYTRVHEFSRDYRKAFGMAPTMERAAWNAAA